MLEAASAIDFTPTLRFYRWSPPALSLGRFQPLKDVDLESCAAEGIEVVRRPTGGKSILHLDDFTYSVIIPRGFPLPDSVVEAYRLVCGGILRALELLGLDAAIQPRAGTDYRKAGGACFASSTQADLEYGGCKLCGSAQLRRGGALLQHGSILLEDRSGLLFKLLRFSEEAERQRYLCDYKKRCVALNETGRRFEWSEVADSFLRGFGGFFGVEITQGRLSTWEIERWGVLTRAYISETWLDNAESRAFPR
jgi:lipoate-protein ligase A